MQLFVNTYRYTIVIIFENNVNMIFYFIKKERSTKHDVIKDKVIKASFFLFDLISAEFCKHKSLISFEYHADRPAVNE